MINSKKGQEMYASVTPIYDKSPLMQGVFETVGSEADTSIELADEILRESFPQTAISWGLTNWEKRLGLVTNTAEDVEKRRRKILIKLQSKSIINPEKMRYILKSLTGLEVDVIDKVADYIFGVTITSTKSFDIDINEVITQIKKIKPSHLGYKLGLETPKIINISMSREYVFNSLNMCGQFNCGDGIVISSFGRTFESSFKTHVDYNKNIKNYDLLGTILASQNQEFESGIATIGRVYSGNENIKSTRDYLYDAKLSKTDGYIIGSLYKATIKATSSYNNAINTYDESGNDLTGEFVTGSTETLISTLGRLYESNGNIETTERVIFDTQLNKASSTDPIVGSLNELTIEIETSSENNIKAYSLSGFILAGLNIDNENLETTIGRSYDSEITESSNETNNVKEYNQAGTILASEEGLL